VLTAGAAAAAGNLSFLVLQAVRPGATAADPKVVCDTILFNGLTVLIAGGILQ
jgi:hypothetical protein